MLIKAGFDITLECAQPTPMVLLMSVHPDRRADIIGGDDIAATPKTPITSFIDRFGNLSHRLVAQPGLINLSSSFAIRDSGDPDPEYPDAIQHDVADLPEEALPFLLGSRYCDTDLLMETAWREFGNISQGWARVQAIVDFAHKHLTFGYHHARPTRTAFLAYQERIGVCRDFAHLAIALCRCVNIPARYCNGYLGDIGVPPDPAPMDFNAWFEVYLGGRWHVFDARHNQRRIGRVVIARGMDAADTAMITAFGAHTLRKFEVTTEEIAPPPGAAAGLARAAAGAVMPAA
ncbi:transglutaminase family protein [Terrarubrum flagellatum]|uniref:transglutaminase-like domain-containing protein n=1 Tax=Terrirubrum flagellatum TaxID=2895980 RepID=UPI003144E17E